MFFQCTLGRDAVVLLYMLKIICSSIPAWWVPSLILNPESRVVTCESKMFKSDSIIVFALSTFFGEPWNIWSKAFLLASIMVNESVKKTFHSDYQVAIMALQAGIHS